MKKPFFSIIIPTYNRNDQLTTCLHSLTCLNYSPTNFEVIIVNDGGEVQLDHLIAPFKSKIKVLAIDKNNGGPASARNAGAEIAKGDFLVFIDDDCQPDLEWLMQLEERLRTNPNCLIGGKTLNMFEDNIYSTASQIIIEIVYKYYNKNPEKCNFFSSNNIALSKRHFREVGGFDEQFRTAEDRDLCNRWLNKGLIIKYANNALIYHAIELNLFTFCKQYFNYGRGSYLFYKKMCTNYLAYFRTLLKFNFNPRNLLLYPEPEHNIFRSLLLVILLILWQITNAAGFIFELMNNKLKTSNTPI